MELASKKSTILLVEDAPENIELIGGLLSQHYNVKIAATGERALKLLETGKPPDLILLDVILPGISGWVVCEAIKQMPHLQHVPVMFLTAKTDADDERAGLELGAVDYIRKPINPPILLARVDTHLQLKQARDFLRDNNAYLTAEVSRRMEQIVALQDVTVVALASLAETRDQETGNHMRRTQLYIEALVRALRQHPKFADFLTDEEASIIVRAAPLHDIGKVGIPDRVLLKPGKLDPDEFEIMKTHTQLGHDALLHAEHAMPFKSQFLREARSIAWSHHEKWDGSGYPQGLAAEAIPIAARLMAVADVYDAIISKRCYKNSMSHDTALGVIRDGAGSHFDPDIAAAFLSIGDEIAQIASSHSDH